MGEKRLYRTHPTTPSRHVTPRASVRAAHLHVSLQSHLREARREVLLPVVQRGVHAGELREFAFHEIHERLARDVVVNAVSVHEVHRNVHDVLSVSLEPEPVLVDPGQRPGPVRVRVLPHVRSQRLHTARLAVDERRVGEERRRDGLRGNRPYELKGVRGGVERRRGVSGLKARGDGRRDAPGEKILKE
eukprot:31375-Pelagococcus_subviridis.AAC.7